MASTYLLAFLDVPLGCDLDTEVSVQNPVADLSVVVARVVQAGVHGEHAGEVGLRGFLLLQDLQQAQSFQVVLHVRHEPGHVQVCHVQSN